MTNPYEKCPVFESENYLLRLIEPADVKDLLLVYSDEKAVPLFNGDNCNGDDFHYTTPERIAAVEKFGFQLSEEAIIGKDDGREYKDYYVISSH